VVRYAGLALTGADADLGGGVARGDDHRKTGVVGRIIAFRVEGRLKGLSHGQILRRIGHDPGDGPTRTLIGLIEQRASELQLPDGAVVVPHLPGHPCPWPDLLSLIAIVTKSSAHVWLRSKEPRLTRIGEPRAVSLLVPPTFAADIPETVS